MKFRIGTTTDEIEVGQYRLMEKGALKAFFSLVLYPHGQKILDCRYFEQGDSRWFSFPQKEVKYSDGRKTEYIPLVTYLNKEYLDQLKTAVLAALKEVKPMESYGQSAKQTGQAKVQADPRQTNKVRSSAPSDWEECPF